MLFTGLGLSEPILRAIAEEGYYTSPTSIQAKSIPAVLKGGDLLAAAQTGTGKCWLHLTHFQRLSSSKTSSGTRLLRVLILTPTREACCASPRVSCDLWKVHSPEINRHLWRSWG